MNTGVIETENRELHTFGHAALLAHMEQEIMKLDQLPQGAYINSFSFWRNESNDYFECRIWVRGATVKHGDYNDYFLNRRGRLQYGTDTYLFRWSAGQMPELITYHTGVRRKIWVNPNPQTKYIEHR